MNRPRWLLSSSEYNFLHPAFWFGDVDARPLALFRMAFALLMLKEAVYRIFVADMWYGDAGMFPLRLLPRIAPDTPTLMSGLNETWMVIGFLLVWGLVALLLLVGWQTRLMSVINLVMLVSVINRSPFVVTGADSVMQVLAFWSLFVPLGRCYSLDARRRPQERYPRTYVFPVRMLQIQFVLIYVFTTIYKLEGQTWINGDALYMAMQVRMHAFPIAEWLLNNASMGVLHVLTYIALLIEGAFGVLVLAPVFQPFLRRVGLVAGVILHVGIGVVMNVPNFPIVMISSYLLLLDSGWMDWVDGRLRRGRITEPATSQAENAQATGCAGVLVAGSRGMVVGAYRGVLACALLGVMVSVLWGNLLTNDAIAVRLNVPAMPVSIESKLRAVGLWEGWTMFAPDPLRYEGWFGIVGTAADGTQTELRGKGERPQWYVGSLARWGKLEENLMFKDPDDPLFSAWLLYTCRVYRDQGYERLQIVLHRRQTSAPGEAFRPYETVVMQDAVCK